MNDVELLRMILTAFVATVTFTKTDGSERVMRCTLMKRYLPENDEELPGREPYPGVLAVMDLDKNAWRSFRISSVKKVEFTF